MTRKIIYALIGMTFLFSACEDRINDDLSEVVISDEISNSFDIRPKESMTTRQLRITLNAIANSLGEHAASSMIVRNELNSLVRKHGNVVNLEFFRHSAALREVIIDAQRIIEEDGGLGVEIGEPPVPGAVDPDIGFPLPCGEIALPNSFLIHNNSPVTTVAHPLSFANSSNGKEYRLISLMDLEINNVIVDANYLVNNDNVIIVRPTRYDGECTYDFLSQNLDFTLFPNN